MPIRGKRCYNIYDPEHRLKTEETIMINEK
jgi:hypothetical protein